MPKAPYSTNDLSAVALLPAEIIRLISTSSEALCALLFSLTCKQIHKILSTDNRLWHSIYLRERLVHSIDIKGTIAAEGEDNCCKRKIKIIIIYNIFIWSVMTDASLGWEREEGSLQTQCEYSLTSDCLDFQNDMIAEDEAYQKYLPLRFYTGNEN